MELATILLVAVVIAVYLRSILAPLVTLGAAGLSYLPAVHVLGYLAQAQGVRVQQEIEPIIVVLLLGVVTDYSVFFLSGLRGRIRAGEAPGESARRATAEVAPIIFTAGLLVATGLATLRLASIGFVQALGPAMAVVVLVSLGVSMLFVPAMMGILGRALFWPGLRAGRKIDPLSTRIGDAMRRIVARGTRHRWIAIPTVALAGIGLVLACSGLAHTHLALTPIRGLDSDTPPARAARAAERGFTPGIVAPTEILLRGRGVARRAEGLRRLDRALRAQSEVGAVVGGSTLPLPRRYALVFRTRWGDGVRYFVAFQHHP